MSLWLSEESISIFCGGFGAQIGFLVLLSIRQFGIRSGRRTFGAGSETLPPPPPPPPPVKKVGKWHRIIPTDLGSDFSSIYVGMRMTMRMLGDRFAHKTRHSNVPESIFIYHARLIWPHVTRLTHKHTHARTHKVP